MERKKYFIDKTQKQSTKYTKKIYLYVFDYKIKPNYS